MAVNPRPIPANMFDMNDLPPAPPRLTRQNAVVLADSVTINNNSYPLLNYDGIDFVEVDGAIYNLKTDANGRYIIMNGVNTPAQGGRRRSKRRKSRKSKRSRRV